MLRSLFFNQLSFSFTLLMVSSACTIDIPEENEIGESGVIIVDGGWKETLPPEMLDAGTGIIEYEGEAEIGVKCGEQDNVCGVEDSCCLSVALENIDVDAGVSNGAQIVTAECLATSNFDALCMTPLKVTCDDSELDCSNGDVCCASLQLDISNPELVTSCVERSQCIPEDISLPDRFEVCTTKEDCSFGLSCCGASISGVQLPLDLGLCQLACELPANPMGG